VQAGAAPGVAPGSPPVGVGRAGCVAGRPDRRRHVVIPGAVRRGLPTAAPV